MNIDSKVIGNNTDWYGFTMAMQRNKINLKNCTVILIGAGGVAKSIIFSLKNLEVKNIIILKRNFIEEIFPKDEIITTIPMEKSHDVIKNNSIIINATPLGMHGDESPVSKSLIHGDQVLIDIIYTPYQTAFLKFGNNIGALTLNGLDMFIEQGLASLDLWFGSSISKKVNFTQLKAYLGSKLC